ncbi:N-acetylmuramoyl-L-alanine amidase LytC [bioreactor metagenome]|uniref:N-acetylmuramoyl-L-alanine amidase LytC n=1 Tax=bioreactor metagenome TaxID=1076179 RepID=A0A644SY77_9ZZZZ|nr:N-acetylmuramoyl-L-alanine amidase [Negativicutes bacterium]
MRDFINQGHAPNGDPDPGAVSPAGTRESDIAFDVGLMVAEFLETAGHEVIVSQSDSLETIVSGANFNQSDIFVSIHCNAAANPDARGTETFHYYGSSAGRKLATCIQKQIVSSLPVVDRGVKEAGFYVLKNTDMPSVLVELAFISNEDDEKLLINNKRDFAAAIARGVTDYASTD